MGAKGVGEIHHRGRWLALAVALVAAPIVSGCGGDDEEGRFEGLPVSVAVGEDAVWVSTDRAEIFRLNPESEELSELEREVECPPACLSGDLAVGEGSIWIFVGATGSDVSSLDRLDPETGEEVDDDPIFGLGSAYSFAVGEGAVWLAGDEGLRRVDVASGQGATTQVPSDYAEDVAVGEGAVWVVASAISAARDVVAKVDPATGEVVDQVAIGEAESAEARLAAGAGAIWVVQSFDTDIVDPSEERDPGLVFRIDPETLAVSDPVEVGEGSHEIAAGEDGVWVSEAEADQVLELDPESGEVDETHDVGPAPGSLAVGFGAVWVATGELTETGETVEDDGAELEPEGTDVVRLAP